MTEESWFSFQDRQETCLFIFHPNSLNQQWCSIIVPVYLSSKQPKPATVLNYPPIQWIGKIIFPVVKRPHVKLTAHFLIVSKLRMSGAVSPPLHMASWSAKGQFRHLF